MLISYLKIKKGVPIGSGQWSQKKPDFNLIGKIKVKVLIITPLIIVTILATQLIFAATLATDGQKLAQIENEIKRLETENNLLRVEILQESSLQTLAQKAQSLGLGQPSLVITP